MPHFDTLKIYSCGKQAISPFLTMFSTLYGTVKPRYFESQSYESPRFFELYPKSGQKVHCIATSNYRDFTVLIFRFKCTSKCRLQFVSILPSLKFYMVMG